MKQVIEREDGLYHWRETPEDQSVNSYTVSMPFEKDSDEYNNLISSGVPVVTL